MASDPVTTDDLLAHMQREAERGESVMLTPEEVALVLARVVGIAATVEELREAMAPTPEGAMAMLRRVRDILDKAPPAHLSERDARAGGDHADD